MTAANRGKLILSDDGELTIWPVGASPVWRGFTWRSIARALVAAWPALAPDRVRLLVDDDGFSHYEILTRAEAELFCWVCHYQTNCSSEAK